MNKRLLIISILLMVGLASFITAQTNETNQTSVDANNTTINNTLITNNATINNTIENNTVVNSTTNQSAKWTERCAAVDHRVEGRIKMFEEDRDPHFTKFVRLAEQFEKIINKSYIKGYNTSVLDADLVILNEKILKFQNDYSVFIQKLENTRNYTCGHSEGQFKNALNESKAQLKILRADAEDIKHFYEETIKKDISNLREQRKEEAEKRKNDREQNRNKFMEERGNKTREGMEKIRNWTRNGTREKSEKSRRGGE